MNKIIPFNYVWVIILIILNILLGFNYIELGTILYIAPIITIIIMFIKSLYIKPKNSAVTIIFCAISILVLLNIIFPTASALIGLFFLIDLMLFEFDYQDEAECGRDVGFHYDSNTNLCGMIVLVIINGALLINGAGDIILFVTPISEITKDNMRNHLKINKQGIIYDKEEFEPSLKDSIPDDISTNIAYERKYRYIRTIHCEDTDLKCMEQKIEVFNQ